MRVLLLCVVAGCYGPHYKDCEITCGAQSCPDGLACDGQGFCRVGPVTHACSQPPIDAAGPDAPPGQWAPPQLVSLTPPASTTGDDDPSLTSDMLVLYMNRIDQVAIATRPTTSSGWGTPQSFQYTCTNLAANGPEISLDGLTFLWSCTSTPGGNYDLQMATRPMTTSSWGALVDLTALDSTAIDTAPSLSADGLTIVFESDRLTAGLPDLFISHRPNITSMTWSAPVELAELDSPSGEGSPMLSSDELTIYFHSDRTGDRDLYVATRPDRGSSFSAPQPITELNMAGVDDEDPWISPDGHHLFFASTRGGVKALYETSR